MEDLEDDLNVDLTPLIDVIFMLVIFFLMTTTFALPVIELTLPNSTTATAVPQKPNTLKVLIDSTGQILVENKILLKNELDAYLSSHNYKNIELSIDAKAPAQALIDLADLARMHTNGSLSITTIKEKNSWE